MTSSHVQSGTRKGWLLRHEACQFTFGPWHDDVDRQVMVDRQTSSYSIIDEVLQGQQHRAESFESQLPLVQLFHNFLGALNIRGT